MTDARGGEGWEGRGGAEGREGEVSADDVQQIFILRAGLFTWNPELPHRCHVRLGSGHGCTGSKANWATPQARHYTQPRCPGFHKIAYIHISYLSYNHCVLDPEGGYMQ